MYTSVDTVSREILTGSSQDAVFYVCAWVVLLIAGVVLWAGAAATGVVGNVEHFMRDIGFECCHTKWGNRWRAEFVGVPRLVKAGEGEVKGRGSAKVA